MAKTYGVIGLGKFGFYVASALIEQGQKVVVADVSEQAIYAISQQTELAYILDSTDTNALKEAGFSNLDFVIVSIGENIESSILTLMALKELGVKNIITKAITNIHGKILSKLGASKVIYPEKEAAQHLLRSFITHPEFENIDISSSLKVCKFSVTKDYVGKSAVEILRSLVGKKECEIKVIAIKENTDSEWNLSPSDDIVLFEGARIVYFGTQEYMDKIKP